MSTDLAFLRAQLTTVEALLSDLPANEQIERMGLQRRREDLSAELAATEARHPNPPASVELTFRGDPVMGSRGIEAGFAARVLATFKQAVTAIAADVRGHPLADTGRLPVNDRLLITGCALGSFGFRMEESLEEQGSAEPSAMTRSIGQAKAILEGCAQGDEALADAMGDANPRVLTSIRDFLGHLKTAGATCTVALPESRFSFESLDDVERALERATLGVNESIHDIRGILRGVLPDTRKFEFKTEAGEILSGKIDHKLDNPEELIPLQGKACTVHLLIREVGRMHIVRRYTLLSLEPLIVQGR